MLCFVFQCDRQMEARYGLLRIISHTEMDWDAFTANFVSKRVQNKDMETSRQMDIEVFLLQRHFTFSPQELSTVSEARAGNTPKSTHRFPSLKQTLIKLSFWVYSISFTQYSKRNYAVFAYNKQASVVHIWILTLWH